MFSNASPDRAFTAIGMIGRLKLSDRIRIRVDTDAPLAAPLLLHEASYNEYRYASWRNNEAVLTALDPTGDGHSWRLRPAGRADRRTAITVALREDTAVIPLPAAADTLHSEQILGIQQYRFGTIVADARAGFIRYQVQYGEGTVANDEPSPADLFVPEAYQHALEQIRTELALTSTDQREIVTAVERFFRQNFEYSLVQRGRSAFTQPLNAFLLERRRGHCEYFATATVLLLRKLGVPARYAVGYSVSEYNRLERQYVARQRDAHAWALAQVNGRWQTVDTTPPEWRAREDASAGAFAGLFDLTGWIAYQWAQWQLSDSRLRAILPWLLPPLIGWLLWRLRGTRLTRQAPAAAARATVHGAGMDSEFLSVVRTLSERGHAPLDGSPATWARRRSRMAGADRIALPLPLRSGGAVHRRA
jgi:protein-glutamine gamma-glutamyltransferase